jgi:hypothetical protein
MCSQGDAAYELEIDATEEEAAQLADLFGQLEDADEKTSFRNHIPAIPYHHDSENDQYDALFIEIYRTIHELGTDETKRHIDSMNLHMGTWNE